MLEIILSVKEINFNQLEKEIFKIGCEYAQACAAKAVDEEVLKHM